jgi:hypothetical protein
MVWWTKALAAITILAFLVAGCAGPGQGIADRIRAANSPIVREVYLSAANFWEGSGDAVKVYLVDEASDAEALELWCTVVLPAGAEELPPGGVQLFKGFEPTPGGGRSGGSLVLESATCPEGGSGNSLG